MWEQKGKFLFNLLFQSIGIDPDTTDISQLLIIIHLKKKPGFKPGLLFLFNGINS